jgi:8-oxo-dGTP diphosphatase
MTDHATDKTHLVLVNAVVEKDGKILVSQRSQEETHDPGKWTIPGGKVERTEGNVWNIIEKTLADEVREETGLEIADKVDLIANNTFIRSTGQHTVALIFLCHWKAGEAQALEETSDVKWISRNEIGNFDFSPNVDKYIIKGFDLLETL